MTQITGAIVDSWVESSGRVVLQVAPRGQRGQLLIVEADCGLVGDEGWLADLGENMCHGSPVSALGSVTDGGFIQATQIQLAR
jgi:hypothetical protein